MLTKTLDVQVDGKTFDKQKIPPRLLGPSSVNIDVGAALVMLGSLTIPGGFSSASPARFWAWIRYFSAVAKESDLRIVGPFVDLDPHQMTILSDDFGVAISTRWLYDVLGGFKEIIDGRRFLLQYSSLVRTPPPRKPPKVGAGKCPDFVLQDRLGKWHVLECKGTQSSVAYRNYQLKKAFAQKSVIQIIGSVRGERLAAGLFLGNERETDVSHLRVIDPSKVEPYIVFDERRQKEAETAARRLATSRAFGLAGLQQLADEIATPQEVEERFMPLYLPEERRRLQRPAAERITSAIEQAAQPRIQFQDDNTTYLGREATLEIPGDDFYANTGFRNVTVRQGVNAEVVHRIRSAPAEDFIEQVDEIARPLVGPKEGVHVQSEDGTVMLKDGRLFISTLEFH